MSIIHWPAQLLPPTARPAITLAGQSTSGGRALSGVERVREGQPYWRMSFPLRLRGSVQILTWRAICAQLRGRRHALSVPVFECGRSPGALPDFRLPSHAVPHSDDALFSDGSLYAGLAYHASIVAALPARATACVLEIEDAPAVAPWPGMYFSLGGRLCIVETAGDVAGGQCAVTFQPPLREAVPAGTVARFDGASGFWRFADDQAGAIPLEPQGQGVEFTVTFVEVQEPV